VIDRDVDGVRLVPASPRSIAGKVQLEEGTRLKFPLLVYAFGAAEFPLPPIVPASVDPGTGEFQLNGVVYEQYRLRVSTAGGYVQSVSLGARDVTGSGISFAGENGPLTIRMAVATGRVRGKVTAPGKQLGQVWLTAAPVGARAGRKDLVVVTTTLNDGTFRFPSLPAGQYRVYAWEVHDSSGWTELPEFLERIPGSTVEVRDQQEINVEVRLIPAAEMEQARATF
jgi:hypothetical protein